MSAEGTYKPMNAYGIDRFSRSRPDEISILDTHGRSWTRAQLSSAVNQIAHGLRRREMRPGDVLAIVAPNCLEFVALYLAATDIGLYVVPINWHLAPAEIAFILENSGATAIASHSRLAPLVRQVFQVDACRALATRICIGSLPGFTGLEDFRSAEPATRVPDPIVGRTLMYTSATTGRPKAIEVPIGDAARTLSRTIDFFLSTGLALEDDNVHLCASMLYHAAPLEFVATSLHMGHRVVLMERWEAEPLLALIHEHRVTTSFMVPSMFIRLLKLPEPVRTRYITSSLRLVSHSAAPCPPEVKRALIEWWGPIIWEGYGAAEGQGTVVSSQDWLQRPGTVGRPIPGSAVRIFDDQGHELPPGQTGTIYLSRFTGDRFSYRNDPEKTRAAYRGDLFTVGDVGYLDEAGYLYISDRKVDMIICSGMNIYPAEIEQALVQHPGVFDCAVLGVPDSLMGESVRAVVQPAPGVQPDDALTADLMNFLRLRISAFKLPRRIDYVTALPRDPNGKLFKRTLREQYWAGHARRI